MPAFHVNGKDHSFRSDLFFHRLCPFHNQTMEPGEREIVSRLSTASFRFHQGVIDALDRLHVVPNVGAGKLRTRKWLSWGPLRSAGGRRCIATFFPALRGAPPHLAKRSISSRQGIIMIELGEM